MSCIKKDIIQKYIDGEATPKEVAMVNEHAMNCEICVQKINHQKQLAIRLKKAINLSVGDAKDIPMLKIAIAPAKKHFLTKRKMIYSISAACLLSFVVFICRNENVPEIQNQVTFVHCLGNEVDANRPVTDQPIIINVIDEKGNITEYIDK